MCPQHLGGTEPEGEAAQLQGWLHTVQWSAQWCWRKLKQNPEPHGPLVLDRRERQVSRVRSVMTSGPGVTRSYILFTIINSKWIIDVNGNWKLKFIEKNTGENLVMGLMAFLSAPHSTWDHGSQGSIWRPLQGSRCLNH